MRTKKIHRFDLLFKTRIRQQVRKTVSANLWSYLAARNRWVSDRPMVRLRTFTLNQISNLTNPHRNPYKDEEVKMPSDTLS